MKLSKAFRGCVGALALALFSSVAQFKSAAAQPVFSTALARSPAAEELARGRYLNAHQQAKARLQTARNTGRVEPDVLLEAAFTNQALGHASHADSLLEELLSAGGKRSDTLEAKALFLRSQVEPTKKSLVSRTEDLEKALKLFASSGSLATSDGILALVSLTVLMCEEAPKLAAPLVSRLESIRASSKEVAPSAERWLAIGLAQCLNLQGQNASAEKILQPLWGELATSIGSAHPDRLYAGHQLGFALRRQGKAPQASAVLTEVLVGRKVMLGSEHPLTLLTTTLLVRQLRDTNKFDEALALAFELEGSVEKAEGSGSVKHLSVANTIAEVLLAKGEPSEALKVQEPAYRKLVVLSPDGEAADDAKFTLAQILHSLGRYREAQEHFEEVNARDQVRYPVGHPNRWAALNNIAVMRGEQFNFLGQLALLEYLEEQMSKEMEPTNPSLVSVRNNQAYALMRLGRNEQAVSLLEQQLTALKAVLQEPDRQLLRAQAQLASAYSANKEHDKAIALHERILKLREKYLPARHPEVANSWHNLGYAFDLANRKEDALVAYNTAFNMRRQRFGLAHPETIRSVRSVAGLQAVMKDFGNAEVTYRQGVEGAESLREYSYHADWLRQSEFSELVGLYKNYARVLAKLGKWPDAFRIVDLSKARTLREVTHRHVKVISSSLNPSEAKALATLERDVAELSSQLALSEALSPQQQAAQTVESGNASHVGKIGLARDEKVRELTSMRTALEIKYGWSKVDNELSASTLDASSFLSPQSVFLNFSKLGDGLLVTMLEPDGKVSGRVTEGDVPGLTSSLSALRRIWSMPSGLADLNAGARGLPPMALWKLNKGGYEVLDLSIPAPEGAVEALSDKDLVDFVSGVVQDVVPPAAWGYKRLVISTDGELAALPFEALIREGRPLVATHEMVYTQSWSMFRLLKQRDAIYSKIPRRDLLILGNPSYGSSDDKSLNQIVGHIGIAGHPGASNGAEGNGLEQLQWGNLPGAAKEVETVANLYGLAPGYGLFVGTEASEDRLRQLNSEGELARYKMVLFAAHGYLDSSVPERSSIVLSQRPRLASTSGNSDGYITAAEWRAMTVRSDLVFLSACDTGLGQIISGEGVTGLPLSMFAGGNQNTVLTLWPIYDESSSTFVVRFFEKVKSGAGFSDALVRTKREFATGAAGDTWRAPAFWAPFILYGH